MFLFDYFTGNYLLRNEALATQKATLNLMNHMHSFHIKQSAEAKQERIERMRRARSMPKLDVEEVIVLLLLHIYVLFNITNTNLGFKSSQIFVC